MAFYSGLIRNNTDCIKCNEDMGYYSIKGKNEAICLNEEIIGEGYFLNKKKIPFVWEECFQNCASCESKGNTQKWIVFHVKQI